MARLIRLHEVAGFSVSALHAGIKESGGRDLGLILSEETCDAAAVFTRNRVSAAPVKHSRSVLRESGGRARVILANAGNANCCTGAQGRRDAAACARRVAGLANCTEGEVLLASTGIIGEPLPMDAVLPGIDRAYGLLDSRKAGDKKFADAIRTLDTHEKEAATTLRIGGKAVSIAGAAKGIGMCAPNMATVLIFLLTDASIRSRALQAILKDTVDETFNRVSVDGDTSTNDSCFLLASGRAGNREIRSAKGQDGEAFRKALQAVCWPLSKMLAADGEGASRFMHVRVRGAKSKRDADRVARSIAESPLVKTAVCGADPNWGRIMMAAGKCGADVREERARVAINGHAVFEAGAPAGFRPSVVSRAMKKKDVLIEVDLGRGRAGAEMLSCDLTHGYITINADYHT